MTKEEARQAMLAAAAAQIERLLAWEESRERTTLTEMEDEVLVARAQVGQHMLEKLIEIREGRRNAAIPVNASSGKRLHPKGQKKGT